METKEVLTVSDIEQILGIGRRQAYELVNSGQFHIIKVGKSIRIHKEVFNRWMRGESLSEDNGNHQ